jgi:hypothetical protein
MNVHPNTSDLHMRGLDAYTHCYRDGALYLKWHMHQLLRTSFFKIFLFSTILSLGCSGHFNRANERLWADVINTAECISTCNDSESIIDEVLVLSIRV